MVRQTWTDLDHVSHVMDFIYDNNGKPYAFYYDGTLYYYITNLQGDVIRIIDTAGATICTYTYDAWGRLLNSSTNQIFKANPIRYRGYYYDAESGLYYLGSRYYDPAVKRFINADGAALAAIGAYNNGLTDKNYFAYCNNAPVNSSDDGGDLPTVIVGAIVGGVLGIAGACADKKTCNKEGILKGAITGAISGAIGSGLSGPASIIFGAASGAIDAAKSAAEGLKDGKINTAGAVVKIVTGAAVGALFSVAGEGGKTEKLSSLKTFGGNIKTMFKNRLKKGTLYTAAKNSARQYWRNSRNQLKWAFVRDFISSGTTKVSSWYSGRWVSWATR